MLKGEAKLLLYMFIAMLAFLALVTYGYLPEYFIFLGPFIIFFALLAIEIIYTYTRYAGKFFLSLAYMKNNEEEEWGFGLIKNVRTFRMRGLYYMLYELEKVRFSDTPLPWKAVVLVFPKEYDLAELASRDFIEPEHVSVKIPILTIYARGVVRSFIIKKYMKNQGIVKKILRRKPELEPYQVPLVYVTRAKPYDAALLSKLDKAISELESTKSLLPYREAVELGIKHYIDNTKNIIIIDTQLEETLKQNEELKRKVQTLEKVLADEGTLFAVKEKFVEPEKVVSGGITTKHVLIAGAVALTVFIVLILLGVI